MSSSVKAIVKLNHVELQQLPSSQEVQDSIDAVAQAVLRMQKALVPVDTGRLSRDLRIVKVGNSRQVGSFNVDYAQYVEFGYHHYKSGKFIPAQPYIRPSLNAARSVRG